MDVQVVVAVITGLFGAVVAPLITQVVIPRMRGRRSDSRPESKPKRSLSTPLHAGVGGVIGVLVGYLLISPIVVSPCPPFAPASVNIVSPVAGSSIPRLITVQGTACHIPTRKELWLLVVTEGVTAYYPQTGPVVVSSDGNWSASAYIGLDDPIDIGRGFVLIAALADQQGSAAVRTYFAQSGPQFKGLEPLPQGVQLVTQVRVVRR